MKQYTEEQAVAALNKQLADAGIKLQVGGCGCCGSPWATWVLDGHQVHAERAMIDSFADADKCVQSTWDPEVRALPEPAHRFVDNYDDDAPNVWVVPTKEEPNG